MSSHAHVRCHQTRVTVTMGATRLTLTPAPDPGRGPHRGQAHTTQTHVSQAEPWPGRGQTPEMQRTIHNTYYAIKY